MLTIPENAEAPGALKSLLCSCQDEGTKVRPTHMLHEFVPLFLPWPLLISQAWWESVPDNRAIDLVQNRWILVQPCALGLKFLQYHAQEDPIPF